MTTRSKCFNTLTLRDHEIKIVQHIEGNVATRAKLLNMLKLLDHEIDIVQHVEIA